ncbi:uncharacterized protein LOC114272503 [Camellia sinensis]|uniref:uncharacterized protein LOC114272503 n=1 Tax=Camellia sinensis TaxID=4442 RepID=UPI001036E09E|nr:uncharacterized protein LOC114272503 [Camellia sinensis]
MKSWEGLAEIFVARFVTNKLQPLRVDFLMALKIGEGESLRAYAKRYYEVFNRILECNQELAVVSFKNGLEDNCMLRNSLVKTLPKSMGELMARIEKYARAEEDTPGAKAPKQIPVYKVLENIRNQPYYREPERILGEFIERNVAKHCAYHNEDRHLTYSCRALKAHFKDLIKQGHLRGLVDEARMREEQAKLPQAPPTPPPSAPQQQESEPLVINVIHSRINENEVRRETQRVKHLQHMYQVQQRRPRIDECQGPMVSFTDADLDMVQHLHNDALVITLKIGECQFPIEHGIKEVREDQVQAKNCSMAAMKSARNNRN